jgi:hypothetical protein
MPPRQPSEPDDGSPEGERQQDSEQNGEAEPGTFVFHLADVGLMHHGCLGVNGCIMETINNHKKKNICDLQPESAAP